jgi:hypothetical protein
MLAVMLVVVLFTAILIVSLMTGRWSTTTTTITQIHKSIPAISNITVLYGQSVLPMPQGAEIYIYDYATGGAGPSTAWRYGDYETAIDGNGNTASAIAVTGSNRDSYGTQTAYNTAAGIAISGFSSYSSYYAENTTPGAASESDTFSVTTPESLVLVIAMGSSQHCIRMNGMPGFIVDNTTSGIYDTEALIIGHAYLNPGSYNATMNTQACLGGQDSDNMVDTVAVFVFAPSNYTG